MAKTKRRSAQASRRSVQGAQQHKPIQEKLATTPTDTDGPAQPTANIETTMPREQERIPRPQRSETSRAAARAAMRETTNRTPKNNTRKRYQKKRNNSWLWLVFAAAVITIIIVVFVITGNQKQASNSNTGTRATNPAILKAITTVDTGIQDTVNTGGLQNPIVATRGKPAVLKGPTGKPEFFYDGAEYCPYCAAERWSTVVALSRFGTFTKLPLTSSSSIDTFPNTATVSFYGSAYTSSYVDFVPVEETTNQADSSGRYPPLQTPTADQATIIKTYNAAPYTTQPGIPFVSIANQYLELGPAFSPDVLSGLTQQDIVAKLTDPTNLVTKDILGGANYMTAAICAVTNNQPTSVCTSGAIPQIQKSLPKPTASIQGVGTQTVLAAEPGALARRRED